MNVTVINILDLCESIGEASVKEILSDFSCAKNNDIQEFLQQKAIDFAKRKLSVTYLVFNEADAFLLGYFTLTHKPLRIDAGLLESVTLKRKLTKFARFDEDTGAYDSSAFLIAQFGKNDGVRDAYGFMGDELMERALGTLKSIQHLIGGGIVFLECEEKSELLQFYQSEHNRYKRFGERYAAADQKKYIQLLRFF